MKISKISEQTKNKDRVNIYIDAKYAFSLTLGQLLALHLKTDDKIDTDSLILYKKMSESGKLKMRTIEWLMIRPHSVKELRDYLKRKKLELIEIDTWAQELQEKRYLNNESFAVWWVDQRRRQQRSATYIKHELRSKGVAEDIINEALESYELDDSAVLKKLITHKRTLLKYQDNKKLISYLMQQGYNYSLIKEVLAE
jgi:regulatory protein